jgi:hypothetical protein
VKVPFIASAAVAVAVVAVSSLDAQTLRGSRASVDRIHQQAVQQNLHFHSNSASVRRSVQDGTLVRLGGNANYRVEGASYPYLLPEAHTFVERLSAQYRAACGEKLVVTSATRPQTLRLANSSAKSVHPTGMAVDLRKPAKPKCLQWLRTTLLSLERQGVLEAVEEFRPPHFHVAVFPRQYAAYVERRGDSVRYAAGTGPSGAARSSSRAAVAGSAQTRVAVAGNALRQGDGVTYQVRRGDTLWTIARRHGTTVEQIQQANRLRSTDIKAGQRIVIPVAR